MITWYVIHFKFNICLRKILIVSKDTYYNKFQQRVSPIRQSSVDMTGIMMSKHT